MPPPSSLEGSIQLLGQHRRVWREEEADHSPHTAGSIKKVEGRGPPYFGMLVLSMRAAGSAAQSSDPKTVFET